MSRHAPHRRRRHGRTPSTSGEAAGIARLQLLAGGTAKADGTYPQGADFRRVTSAAGVQLSNAAVSLAAGTWTYTHGATR